MVEERPEPELETPDRFGQLGRRHPKDWRGQDRDHFRSTQTVGRLTALVVIPATIVGFGLAASRVIPPIAAVAAIIAIWVIAVAALWWFGRQSRHQ